MKIKTNTKISIETTNGSGKGRHKTISTNFAKILLAE